MGAKGTTKSRRNGKGQKEGIGAGGGELPGIKKLEEKEILINSYLSLT